jgi:hypothetical protein
VNLLLPERNREAMEISDASRRFGLRVELRRNTMPWIFIPALHDAPTTRLLPTPPPVAGPPGSRCA